jgi:hypothetical protein
METLFQKVIQKTIYGEFLGMRKETELLHQVWNKKYWFGIKKRK